MNGLTYIKEYEDLPVICDMLDIFKRREHNLDADVSVMPHK